MRKPELLRSTDFASKGLYKETTTKTSKSQSVFKDVANLRLTGNTFDAQHLDKFMTNRHTGTQFCMSQSPSMVKMTQAKK